MVLYKYRNDSKLTEEIIKSKKVWFATPESLNDPLECSIQNITEKSITKYCEREMAEQLGNFVMAYVMMSEKDLLWGLSKKEIKQVLLKIKKASSLDNKYCIYADFVKSKTENHLLNPATKYTYITNIIKNIGIFSLSETCENELMWGHYADGGKGIAIGFDIQENSSITNYSLCLKVNYMDEPVILNDKIKPSLGIARGENNNPLYFQVPAFDDPFLKLVMSTKNTIWKYEKEWRCIEQIHGLKSINSPIVEIVFGIKCPQNIRDKYTYIARKHCSNSVDFFEIILDGRTLKRRLLSE